MNPSDSNGGPLPSHVVEWTASFLVTSMSNADILQKYGDEESAHKKYVAKLSFSGLSTLVKKDLKKIWDVLKVQPFVYGNKHGHQTHVSSNAKKDDMVRHIEQFLRLAKEADLSPLTKSGTSLPAAATASQQPARAPIPTNEYQTQLQQQYTPGYRCSLGYNRNSNSSNHPLGGVEAKAACPYANYNRNVPFIACKENGFFINDRTFPSLFPPTTAGGANSGGKPASTRKRPAPESFNHTFSNHGFPEFTETATANMSTPWANLRGQYHQPGKSTPHAGAPHVTPAPAPACTTHSAPQNLLNNAATSSPMATPNNDAPSDVNDLLSPHDRQLFVELRAMGFTPDDCKNGIRGFRESKKEETPDADSIMCFIIEQKEEAELARQLDEARKLSEAQKEKEDKEMGSSRKEKNDECLLNATLADWLQSKDMENKPMFPDSRLLRHGPVKSLLEEVASDKKHLETKRSLVQLLTLEKKAGKWYDIDLPKSYFTNELGRRFINASITSLKSVIDSAVEEVNRGFSLRSEQVDEIPRIFLEAKEKDEKNNSSSCSNGNTVSHDDDIVMLGKNDSALGKDTSSDDCRKPAAVASREVEVIELL